MVSPRRDDHLQILGETVTSMGGRRRRCDFRMAQPSQGSRSVYNYLFHVPFTAFLDISGSSHCTGRKVNDKRHHIAIGPSHVNYVPHRGREVLGEVPITRFGHRCSWRAGQEPAGICFECIGRVVAAVRWSKGRTAAWPNMYKHALGMQYSSVLCCSKYFCCVSG